MRRAERNPDAIYAPTGNGRWVVWLQTGFTLDHADWTMWVLDRQSGDVRKLASSDPGPDGLAAPGFATPIQILGDEATWSAPVWTVFGKVIESRVYVADLPGGTVRRLSPNARFPYLTGPGQVTAAIAEGEDAAGHLLARPGVFDPATDDVAFVPDFEPARVSAFAAGAGGMIEVRILSSATDERPWAIADVALRDASGTAREYSLPMDWGPVAVGDDVIVWEDMYGLWALARGQESPTLLDQSEESSDSAVSSYGGLVLWRSQLSDPVASLALIRADCP